MSSCAELKFSFKLDTTTIDNRIFWLHYRATTVILLAFSIYVLCWQCFGVAIDCSRIDGIAKDTVDTYCLIHGTFSSQDAWENVVGREIIYPGIDIKDDGDETKRVYHTYYQWVWCVLFLQAIFFYFPRYFWKSMEGGRMRSLVLGLNSPILSEETNFKHRRLFLKYLTSNINNHSRYFVIYAVAEVMNFLNVIGQIFLVNAFLGGEFLAFGLNVMEFKGWKKPVGYDPMVKVFPRLAKCTFRKYGASGTVQQYNQVCTLPMNILNEKIYIFLWFWFVILAVLSGAIIVYRGVIFLWPKSLLVVSRYRERLVNQDYLETIISKGQIGDWLILDLLSKNIDPLLFRDVVNDLGRVGRKVDNNSSEEVSSCNL